MEGRRIAFRAQKVRFFYFPCSTDASSAQPASQPVSTHQSVTKIHVYYVLSAYGAGAGAGTDEPICFARWISQLSLNIDGEACQHLSGRIDKQRGCRQTVNQTLTQIWHSTNDKPSERAIFIVLAEFVNLIYFHYDHLLYVDSVPSLRW